MTGAAGRRVSCLPRAPQRPGLWTAGPSPSRRPPARPPARLWGQPAAQPPLTRSAPAPASAALAPMAALGGARRRPLLLLLLGEGPGTAGQGAAGRESPGVLGWAGGGRRHEGPGEGGGGPASRLRPGGGRRLGSGAEPSGRCLRSWGERSAKGRLRCGVTKLVLWVLSWKISGVLVSGQLWFIHGGLREAVRPRRQDLRGALSSRGTRLSPRTE